MEDALYKCLIIKDSFIMFVIHVMFLIDVNVWLRESNVLVN